MSWLLVVHNLCFKINSLSYGDNFLHSGYYTILILTVYYTYTYVYIYIYYIYYNFCIGSKPVGKSKDRLGKMKGWC